MRWQKLNPSDARHLAWLHERLVSVHKEDKNYDYMIRFREIIHKVTYASE